MERTATAVVQSNVSPKFRLAWSDTPVMSGHCKGFAVARTYKLPCPCTQGEYDVPLRPDAECILCGHPHSQHEVASHDTVDNTIQTLTEQRFDERATDKRAMLSALYGDWRAKFIGGSVDVLRNLALNEEEESGSNRYCKMMSIIQSSGTGKSRLLDEISKEFLTISFILRRPMEDGYPPGDPEITTFLTGMANMIASESRLNAVLHAHTVALLAGTLAQLREWYDQQPSSTAVQVIAKSFHDQMAPSNPSDPLSKSDLRSAFRITFIDGLLQKARELTHVFADDSSWEKACSDGLNGTVNPEAMTNHLLVRKHLIAPTLILMKQLEQRPKEPRNTNDGPRETKELLLLVFDEAANLWLQPSKTQKDGTPFFVLRRTLGMLKNVPIWSFFLSTQSSTEALMPSWELENSGRIRAGELTILEPFLACQLDVEAFKIMERNYDAELRKPMSQFATARHMTMFGRPLWRAFLKVPHLLRVIALHKLIGSKKYNPTNVNHVFATLASRLCLDVCMEGTEAIALAHKAVNSHLRIVLSIESTRPNHLETVGNQAGPLERMVTITPSEPVVAEAVADLYCWMTDGKHHWTTSITILATDLLSKGLIQKGTKGELFARLLCILARDFHRKAEMVYAPFPHAEPFSVKSFLRSLFNEEWLQKIMDFTLTIPNTRQWDNSQTASFNEVFDQGYMNFTHFTSTEVSLKGATISDLLHKLLRQQAALQLAYRQPVWDILIPVYFGDRYQDFDPARASAVLISVRNRTRPSPFSLQSEVHHYAQFVHTEDPILFILMDLGTTKNEVVVSGLPKAQPQAQSQAQQPQNVQPKAKKGKKGWKAQPKTREIKQHLFGIHALGADAMTYSCFRQPGLWDACKKLLEQVMPAGREVRRDHDDLCERNKRFNYHDWESWFPVSQRVNSEGAAEESDGDAPIEDRDVPMEGMECSNGRDGVRS